MSNINAFWPVVHENYFWRFIKIFLILPLFAPQKGSAPLLLIWIPFSRATFLPSLVEIGLVVLEKSFKEKRWRRTDRRTPYHKLSWPSARWVNNYHSCMNYDGLYNSDSKKYCISKNTLFNYATFFSSSLYNPS